MSLPSSAFKTPPKKGFFKDEADSLKKLLRVKRISRWIQTPDSPGAGTTSEFYESWLRRPVDPHGLLLPCLSGSTTRLWMQRCLRWIPDCQVAGGDAPPVVTGKLTDLLQQVQELQNEIAGRGGLLTEPEHRWPGPEPLALTQTTLRMASSFPFVSRRSWCFKPAVLTHMPRSQLASDQLASQDDECGELISLV